MMMINDLGGADIQNCADLAVGINLKGMTMMGKMEVSMVFAVLINEENWICRGLKGLCLDLQVGFSICFL